MAASPAAVLFLLLVVAAADDTTHLHFFMHDIVSGSNPTSVQVINGPGSGPPTAPSLGLTFGDTHVMDDLLTETSAPTSTPMGRIQGTFMLASQSGAALTVTANILLTTGDYNGSTIAVMGRDDTDLDVRELAVVGGTGKFRMASGYMLWKIAGVNKPDVTIELDVYIGGSGSGSGAKSSSGAARMTTVAGGWVVVAAVVAVIGSWVW